MLEFTLVVFGVLAMLDSMVTENFGASLGMATLAIMAIITALIVMMDRASTSSHGENHDRL